MPRSPIVRTVAAEHRGAHRWRQWMSGIVAVFALVAGSAVIPTVSASADDSSGFTAAQLGATYDSDSWPTSDHTVQLLSGFRAANASATVTHENDTTVQHINETASAEDAAAATTDANSNSADAMADGLGSTISAIYTKALAAGELPKTKALLQNGRVAKGIGSTDQAKAYYNNPRPFLRLSGLKEWTDWSGLAGQGSYPSGHTTSGYTNGTVLATLLPELAPQILARASEYGQHRLVLGVHYPLDVMGGRMLGQAVVAARWNDPAFRVLLEQARTELRDVVAKQCGMSVAACVASQTPYKSTTGSLAEYKQRLDYGFTSIGSTTVAATVPDSAAALLLTTFPNLTEAQRRDVIAATETASGEPLDTTAVDNGSWERVNLAAAMTANITQHADGTLTVNGTTFPAANTPTVNDLQQNGALQQRWLSTPSSRLVMNPLDYGQNKTEVQTNNDGTLPLGVSYYAADSDNRRLGVLGIADHLPAATSTGSGSAATATGFHDTFDTLDPAWAATNVAASTTASTLSVTTDSAWGNLTRSVTADLTTTPVLTVQVPSTTGKWALKVNDGSSATDTTISPDSAQTGTLSFNLAQLTGWSGTKTFSLRLFQIGSGTSTRFDDIVLDNRTDVTPYSDDFTSLNAGWSTIANASPSVSGSTMTLTNPADSSKSWGGVQRTVTDNLDTDPMLTVTVPKVDGAWSLKVNNGGSDIAVQSDTDQTGTFTYNVKKLTGWTGVVTMNLKLNVVGTGSSASFDSVVFGPAVSTLADATTTRTQWRADSLPFSATYDSGGSVSGRDLFHDESSLTRSITTSGFTTSTPTLTGTVTGTVTYNADAHQITVRSDTWSTVIDLQGTDDVQFYTSDHDLLNTTDGTAAPGQGTAYWSADLPKSGTATIGLGYATAAEGTGAAATRAAAAADSSTVTASVARWTSYWNSLLARVPAAQRYDLPDVDTNGVASGDVEQSYYRAWIMLEENVLPVMSETGYRYPQVATGKASGWMKGPDGMKPSASWDSLLGMQYLAYIDPTAATAAYKGMMSMMSSSGQIGGESLPSIKAKTGWDLYQITGDRTVLTDTYNHLTQYLTWAKQNPRWILSTSHDIADEKDSQFVASLLVDLGFAERIATTLGHPAQTTAWKAGQATLAADFRTWFVERGNESVEQYHYTAGSHPDDVGTRSVVAGALHAPGLDATTKQTLVNLFSKNFNQSTALGGLNGVGTKAVKAPDAQLTALGLLDQGQTKLAREWVETILRDVVGTGQFSETYITPAANTTAAEGVRPSVFGAVNTIDFVWMRNGVRSDQGNPSAVNLTSTDGGVSGLTWMGKRYSITNTAGGVASFAGDAVSGQRCRSVTLAAGTSYTIGVDTARCAGGGSGTGGSGTGSSGTGSGTGSGSGGDGGAGHGGAGHGGAGQAGGIADTNAGGAASLGRITVVGTDLQRRTITVRLSTAYRNSAVDFVVHSTPRDLGASRLNSTAQATLRLPADLPAGVHTLEAFRQGRAIASGLFTWPAAAALAITGGVRAPWIGVLAALAALAVVAGTAVIIVRRQTRRRRDEPLV